MRLEELQLHNYYKIVSIGDVARDIWTCCCFCLCQKAAQLGVPENGGKSNVTVTYSGKRKGSVAGMD